uniref:dolichyl-phosphate-mannose--protein mannosyltransferase n=1 Tax=Cyprinus carpio TaxID=7962 RepID=A0A8C1IN32_CYPCA
MVLSEPYWDHHIPLPKLGPLHSRLVTAFVALICFINSYNGDFVFDDSEAIINNKDLNPDTPLSNIWKNDFWGSNLSSNSSHKSYRPLTVLTFRINYLLAGGLHPIGFHVLNVALHCVISVLMIDVFAILIGGLVHDGRGVKLNLSPKASFLAALFFAAHPVHTESVAGIVGRADLLCALFFQLSFLVYCKAFQGGDKKFPVLWIFSSILLCAVAMLCKEQGITVLVSENMLSLFLPKDLWTDFYFLFSTQIGGLVSSGLLMRLALLFLGGSFLLYARWRIMGTGPPSFTEVDNPASFAENVILRIVNYNYYYSLNAWLRMCVFFFFFNVYDSVFYTLCVYRTLTFGLVLLAIPFLPASNLFFRVGFVIAERVLYLSSAGYCLILAYTVGYCSCHWKKHKVCAATLTLLCVNVARSAQRSQHWRSEQSLFTSALSVCPLNAKVQYNVGKNLAYRVNQSAAVKYYREAVRLHPKYVHAMNNLGNILKERNELEEAEELLSSAVHIQPDFAAAWMNLGIVQNSLKKFDKAEQSYWNAIKFRKKYPDCYYNLGRLESEGFFLNALKINPNVASCHGNLAVLYHRWGKLDLAKRHYELSLRLDPNAPGTKENYNMLKRKLEQRQRTVG